MKICDLNSYTQELINILFKQIEFLHIVKELTKVDFFIRKVWVCSHAVIGARSKRCWYICLLNVTIVFEFLIFIGMDFHSFAPDTETAFCPTAVLQQSICTSEPFLVILCDTLFWRSKLIFFTFESA